MNKVSLSVVPKQDDKQKNSFHKSFTNLKLCLLFGMECPKPGKSPRPFVSSHQTFPTICYHEAK